MNRRPPMIAGIAFAVLYAAALVVVPRLPGIDRPGSEVVAHVNEHSGVMRVQVLLAAFGSLALVVVMGYARDRLAGPAAYVFTIGSAAVLIEVNIAMWLVGGLSMHPDQLGSATARTVADVVAMWGPVMTVANIMVAGPILLAANAGGLPRWMGIAAAVFAVEQLIETITIIGPAGSFISPGGPMNFYLGGPLFLGFFLALGVALSVSDESSDGDATDPESRSDAADLGSRVDSDGSDTRSVTDSESGVDAERPDPE